jgi:hypothetical protein
MSDYRTGNFEGKKKSILESSFFTCLKPYLDLLAKGSLFNLIYFIMAGINLILPFAIFATAVNQGIFQYFGGEFVIAFIFAWVVIAFLCWFGIQLWLDRRKKIMAMRSTDFIATVVFSDIVQTSGEWLGTFIGVIGAVVGLVALIMLGKEGVYSFFNILPPGLRFMRNFGAMVILIGPITGFLIIISSRSVAEGIRLLVSHVNNSHDIAVNTRDIAVNIKNSAPAGGQRPVLPAGPKGRSL